jgi:hypothetical protein
MGYAQGQNTVSTANIIDSAVTTAKVNDDAVTLAKLAAGTDGELITWDASGDPAAVAVGTSGQVLTSGGAGVAPTFAAAAGGVLVAIKSLVTTTQTATTGTTYADATGYSITHTQAASGNYTLIMLHSTFGAIGTVTQRRPQFQLLRDSTTIATSSNNEIGAGSGGNMYMTWGGAIHAYSTAGDTSSHTYKLQLKCSNAAAGTSAVAGFFSTGAAHGTMTLMEFEV